MTSPALNDSSLLKTQVYINGQWQSADNGTVIEVVNPANSSKLGAVPNCGSAETRRAIDAAQVAFSTWRTTTADVRCQILRRWAELIAENTEDLALLMTAEQGKPLKEARGEIGYGNSFIEWFAEESKRTYGDVVPTIANDRRLVVIKQPIGVVGAITPWNFPNAMITRKAGAALAAGCTLVLKPASETPYSALALAELGERAGLPPGVFNIVTGDKTQIGAELTSNPIVRKLTFTGSTAVGKLLIAQSSSTVKKVSMELGGNAPFIVFDDADIEGAVDGALKAKYRGMGQTCVCPNRIFVQQGVHDKFVKLLVDQVGRLKTGDGMAKDSDLGPLINQSAVAKVEKHIRDALAKGAKLEIGGHRHELGGTFFQPTVISGVTDQMLVAREETFGPLAPIFKFDSEQDAIRMANDTEFGLAVYFYTRSLGRAWRVSEALEYGMVSLNTGIFSSCAIPFGGVKESGIGREGSKYGIEEFMEIKFICMAGIDE